MKIIFLDIDGVLNSTDYMNALHFNVRSHYSKEQLRESDLISQFTRDKYGHYFDPRCILFLEAIINKTDAKIVISSTWRGSGLETMQKMWKDRNLAGSVIDITPTDKDRHRGTEIEMWLELNSDLPIESYCIIDDDSFDILLEQKPFFVHT